MSVYQKFGVIEDYWTATGSRTIDKGRSDVTNNPADLYVFRVASLRNVAMTAPYFHDGNFQWRRFRKQSASWHVYNLA